MANGMIDRRVARTRAKLEQAHISLIIEKGYEEMTIADICQAANVGRSTFYAHYSGKDDLKRSGFDHLRRQLEDRQRQVLLQTGDMQDRWFSFSLPMFEHAREHNNLRRALSGTRGGTVALETIQRMLSDLVRNELRVRRGKGYPDDLPRELIVQHIVGAYMAVLTWWLDEDTRLPPEQVDTIFRRLLLKGVTPADC